MQYFVSENWVWNWYREKAQRLYNLVNSVPLNYTEFIYPVQNLYLYVLSNQIFKIIHSFLKYIGFQSGTLRRAGSHGGPNTAGTNTNTTNANSPAHLWCCARACGAGGGAPARALLSLYDARRQAFVSERFLVRLDADGFNNYLDKLHTNCAIFTVNICSM